MEKDLKNLEEVQTVEYQIPIEKNRFHIHRYQLKAICDRDVCDVGVGCNKLTQEMGWGVDNQNYQGGDLEMDEWCRYFHEIPAKDRLAYWN